MSSGMKPSSDPGLAQRLPAKRGRQVNLTLNGRDVTGFEGESLSGLLLAEQVWILQKTGDGSWAFFAISDNAMAVWSRCKAAAG
jgi:hypothetical protein